MKKISNIIASLKKIRLSKPHLIILIVSGLFVLFGIAVFVYLRRGQPLFLKGGHGQQSGFGQRPGGAQDFGGPQTANKPRWSGPIPNPPKEKITYYKGLWSGNLFYPDERTNLISDPKVYREWGVNILNIAPGFEINSEGEVRYPIDYPTYDDVDARIGELAERYYKANIHLAMTILVTYKKEFSKPGEDWAGVPIELPKEIVEKPGYLDKLSIVVEDMAKIAQKYHIEMFSPMGEPENIFGVDVTSSWNQEILPIIKKQYKGKIYYKGDLHKGEGENLNFKGYDVLGIMPHPAPPPNDLEELRKVIDSNMDRALAWAKRDGVSQVVVAEHGFKGGNEMWPAENIGIVLEEGSKKLNGVFLSEPIPAVLKTDRGDQIVEQMKRWFLRY